MDWKGRDRRKATVHLKDDDWSRAYINLNPLNEDFRHCGEQDQVPVSSGQKPLTGQSDMKPLENLLVIELSTMITASFAAMMMAEQGARVIKIEPINEGDPMRYLGHNKAGISGLFANCNRGKESIRVDLKTKPGQELVQSLADKADVMINNFRPGVMDEINLGSEVLRARNKRLIYTAITGFGTSGPLANAPAYDPIVQAHIGITDVQADEGHAFVRNLVCDKITAYTACQAVTAALLVRERTGEGQHIDLSMMDAGLFFLFPDGYMTKTLLDDDVIPHIEIRDIYRLVKTLDGEITISAANEKQIFGVVIAIGREDLLLEDGMHKLIAMMQDLDQFEEMIQTAISTLTTAEALQKLQDADVPCAKCHTLDEVINQPQIAANNSLELINHPLLGKMRAVRSPARFNGEQLSLSKPCPAHGEDTIAVLHELGLSEADIASLKESKIVA